MASKTSGMAITSLVTGIIALLLGWIPLLGWVFVALAIIFGIVAILKIRKDPSLSGKGMAIAGLIMGLIGSIAPILTMIGAFAVLGTVASSETHDTSANTADQTAVSSEWQDFGVTYCNPDETSLKKESTFNDRFKNRYVQWTGKVTSIRESGGDYSLSVVHCPSTLTSDIIIQMKSSEKDKLLGYSEGDTITYKAKLTRIGDILGLYAVDGVVIAGKT